MKGEIMNQIKATEDTSGYEIICHLITGFLPPTEMTFRGTPLFNDIKSGIRASSRNRDQAGKQ